MRKNASILFLLRIVKVFLGILNLSIAAKYFGVSLDRDIWLLALSTILVVDLAIWGPVNETFRAKFITVRETEGEEIALSKMNSLLMFTFIVSLLIVLLSIFCSEVLAKLVAPGYSDLEINKLSKMIVYVAPILLLNQLIQIGTSVLNAYDIFFVPEIASFGSTSLNILLTIFLAPTYGIYSLLIAYYIGVFLLLALILYYIGKLKKNIATNFFKTKPNVSFLPFILFAVPFFFPYFFGQANSIIEKSLASKMFMGAVSSIDYSRRFSEMFNTVLSSILTTMLIPQLALYYSRKESNKYVAEFEQIFRFGFFAIMLMVTMFTLSSNSFVSVIYPSLPYSKAQTIAELIMFYSWSSIAIFLYVITGIALMTHGKSKMYAILGVITQIINILINLLLYKKLGFYVFPISLFFAHFLCGAIMLFYFPISDNHISKIVIKLTGIFITILIISFSLKQLLLVHNPILQILYTFFCSALALVLSLFLFKMEEFYLIRSFLKRSK